MPILPIPVWIIRQKRAASPPAHEPCDGPGHVIAFTETEHALRFLKARTSGEWNLLLISRCEELLLLIGDMHQEGVPGFCVDPEHDGSGGHKLTLGDAMDQLNRRGAI